MGAFVLPCNRRSTSFRTLATTKNVRHSRFGSAHLGWGCRVFAGECLGAAECEKCIPSHLSKASRKTKPECLSCRNVRLRMSISECTKGRFLLGKVVLSTANLEALKKRPAGTIYEDRSRIEQFNVSKQLWRHVNECDICNERSQFRHSA